MRSGCCMTGGARHEGSACEPRARHPAALDRRRCLDRSLAASSSRSPSARSSCGSSAATRSASYLHILDAAFGSVGVIVRHAGQGDAADPHRPRLFASRSGCGCGTSARRASSCSARGAPARSCSLPILPAGTPAIVVIPAMMLAGAARRRRCGASIPGDPAGAARGQRDHHHADAQLRRPVLGPVLGLRTVERRRLPADRAVPARGLAAAPDRLRRRSPGPRRADDPPRASCSAWWRGDRLGRPRADALGLRDPAHRRQPARRPLRRHRHRPDDHHRLRHLAAPWPASAG